MAKWKTVGVARLSNSKRVILLAIHELEPHRWLIVNVGDLFALIELKRQQIPILEAEKSS